VQRTADLPSAPHWVGQACLWLLPLGCLAFQAISLNAYYAEYPQHFAEKCSQFGEYLNITHPSPWGVLIGCFAPAIPLTLLWKKRYVYFLYLAVCALFALFIFIAIEDDLASNVNCYRDIGLGYAFVDILQLLQAAILFMFSSVVLLVLGFRRVINVVRIRYRTGAEGPIAPP
jgi:hypothetical protein